ncbi:PCI domain-containing protein 2 isoform X2 [Lycorma delicatula]
MYLDPPVDEIIAAHIRCIWAVGEKKFNQAYTCQTLVVQVLIKCFQSLKDDNWLLPVMNTVCLDLRLLAIKADSVGSGRGGAGKPREALEKAAEVLMACFRICTADNRSSDKHTKKWGMLPLVNQLFKVYFRINKLHLMKPLIRAIESSPLKDRFLISQQITYKYFVGRKAMFDSDYKSANEYLSFAFERCHKSSKKNKRLILIYLVPVKMLLGYMPTKAVLEKYDLLQLWEVVEAVKCGKVYQLSDAMQKHQTFFIKCGIYLILEKLKIITYRNLFKKVYLLSKNPVIPMDHLLLALRFLDNPDTELEEAHCILANLIHEGKVKGYISFGHQKVVLSKTDAFPKLSTLI